MTDKIKKISLTNTKKEMLDAYNELVKNIKEQQELQLNPPKIAEEKVKKEVVQKVQSINLDSISKGVNDLKSEINSSLNNLERNLEIEVKKYEDIQKAINIKENDLKEIFEIEKSAHSLAALIEAQILKKNEFEEEMTLKKESILKEIDTLKADWEKEKNEHEHISKELKENEKKESIRKKEEFDYNFNREKQIAHDKLDDELKKKEKEFNRKIEDKNEELSKRDSVLKEKENRLKDLESKVTQFQKELENAVIKAVEENTNKLQAEFKNKEDYRIKEFEGVKNVLSTKIESFEKIIKEQEKKINELTNKLDDAYTKVQDVAVKTIESASSTKAFSELQKALGDKFFNKNKE